MPDVQILAQEKADAPLKYRVPAAAEFLLKAVYAEMSDNGAAHSWVPCLTIKSDSGHVIAQAIDEGIVVAVGDDAEVSWFPYVKRAAAAASTGGAVDYLILQGVGQTVTRPPIGDSDHSKFNAATALSNDLADWSFVLDGAGDVKEVDTTVPGRYLSVCQFLWNAPAASSKFVVLANMFGAGFNGVSPDETRTSATGFQSFVIAVDSLTSGLGMMTIEPAITAGDASIFYDALYWFILRFRT